MAKIHTMLSCTGYLPETSAKSALRRWLGLASATPLALLPAAPVADETRTLAFTFAVIALSVPLVKVERALVPARYLAFRRAFPIQASEDSKIHALFDLAAKEAMAPHHYVRRIVRLFPAKHKLYADLITKLLQIAAPDGALGVAEYNYISHLSRQFGLTRRAYRQLAAPYGAPRAANAYAVLGVRRSWSDAAIKAAYSRLMKEYHPDRFQAEGASAETITLLTERVATLNAAYSQIVKQRKHAAA